MTLKLISIFSLAFANIILIPLVAYAVSQYDEDGFTIFPTKSDWYMIGYREGVVKAWQDVQLMDQHKIATIDANQDHVVCPKDMVNPEECLGYKDGYSDEAMDQLEQIILIERMCQAVYSLLQENHGDKQPLVQLFISLKYISSNKYQF